MNFEFKESVLKKRLEINTFDTIIENFRIDFKEKETDLLIKSYIVLVYAYWEFSFDEFRKFVVDTYSDKEICSLPHTVKNKVLIKLCITGKNISLNEITDINKIVSINEKIKEHNKKKINEISRVNDLKKYLIATNANPKWSDLKKFLQMFNFDIDKFCKNLKYNNSISDDFEENLNFIIKQRNSIAHKNKNNIDYNSLKNKSSSNRLEKTISEISMDINNLFNFLSDEILKLKENDSIENNK